MSEQRQAAANEKRQGPAAQSALAEVFPGREVRMLSQTWREAVEASVALFSPSVPGEERRRARRQLKMENLARSSIGRVLP